MTSCTRNRVATLNYSIYGVSSFKEDVSSTLVLDNSSINLTSVSLKKDWDTKVSLQ